jgi:hypothetical protein
LFLHFLLSDHGRIDHFDRELLACRNLHSLLHFRKRAFSQRLQEPISTNCLHHSLSFPKKVTKTKKRCCPEKVAKNCHQKVESGSDRPTQAPSASEVSGLLLRTVNGGLEVITIFS